MSCEEKDKGHFQKEKFVPRAAKRDGKKDVGEPQAHRESQRRQDFHCYHLSCDESALVLPVTLSILFKEIHSIEEDGNLHAIADQPKQHEIAVAVGGVIQDADAHGRRIGSLQRERQL